MDCTQPDHYTEVILDSIADGVFTVDCDWRITTFNRAAESIIGISREEAIGRRCYEVFRSSICENRCALKKTLDSGQPIIHETLYIIDTHGQKIPISVSTAILKDQSGNMVGGVETFRDLSQVEELRKQITQKYSFSDIIGRSASMRRIFDILPQVAESDVTVLLSGASGTGKELFARAIHQFSPRKQKAFVAVNCGALPDTLLESELFGYKAGAFTDAKKDKPGRFALAEGGTIFLDEIGDISPAMQVRLLRVLQEKTFEPLGSTKSVQMDVRVVAATNKDLQHLVHSGDFREDLFYRINVMGISIPDLKDRRDDMPLLVNYFVGKLNRIYNKSVSGISDEVMSVFLTHDFPGNVRELQNILEHAFILCNGEVIEVSHLPTHLIPGDRISAVTNGLRLRDMEIIHITNALQQTGGNRNAAAEQLGINPSTLFRKMKTYGISIPKANGRLSEN